MSSPPELQATCTVWLSPGCRNSCWWHLQLMFWPLRARQVSLSFCLESDKVHRLQKTSGLPGDD